MPWRSKGDPVLYVSDPPGIDRHVRRRSRSTHYEISINWSINAFGMTRKH